MAKNKTCQICGKGNATFSDVRAEVICGKCHHWLTGARQYEDGGGSIKRLSSEFQKALEAEAIH